jgi:hypothetical protein
VPFLEGLQILKPTFSVEEYVRKSLTGNLTRRHFIVEELTPNVVGSETKLD